MSTIKLREFSVSSLHVPRLTIMHDGDILRFFGRVGGRMIAELNHITTTVHVKCAGFSEQYCSVQKQCEDNTSCELHGDLLFQPCHRDTCCLRVAGWRMQRLGQYKALTAQYSDLRLSSCLSQTSALRF